MSDLSGPAADTGLSVDWRPGDPVYPDAPRQTSQPRDRRVDLEHLPAQWLAAHGNGAGAQWVYDAAAELERLRKDRSHFQAVAVALGDHLGAICDALGLSYEAEPDVTVGAIKRLRAMEQRAQTIATWNGHAGQAAARAILGEGPA